jgi:hypothetical protein
MSILSWIKGLRFIADFKTFLIDLFVFFQGDKGDKGDRGLTTTLDGNAFPTGFIEGPAGPPGAPGPAGPPGRKVNKSQLLQFIFHVKKK